MADNSVRDWSVECTEEPCPVCNFPTPAVHLYGHGEELAAAYLERHGWAVFRDGSPSKDARAMALEVAARALVAALDAGDAVKPAQDALRAALNGGDQ